MMLDRRFISLKEHKTKPMKLVGGWMQDAGMQNVVRTKAGNLWGAASGRSRAAAPLFMGSHLDTVTKTAGQYDGHVGLITPVT